MTMIVFDFADIRSRMLGDDKPAPKAKPKAEPQSEPLVLTGPHWRLSPVPASPLEQAQKAWLQGKWNDIEGPWNA